MMADDAARKETIQSLSISGGLLLGCFGLYNLCTSAGVDEVLAGQVVLLTLVALGSVLVFFDGGLTQAALEANAVQQMAAEEGMTMSKAPRVALQAEPQAEQWGDKLKTDGLLRVDGLLAAEDASSLVSYVETRLSEGLEAVKEDEMKSYQYFGNVLVRNNRCLTCACIPPALSAPSHRATPYHRYDVKLKLDPPVEAALLPMVSRLQPTLKEVLGDDAELFELAALVSDPGAPRQPMHPDTTRRKDAPEGDAPAVVTAFVALQDVDEEMGPTVFLPGSQSAEAHAAFYADDASRAKSELLRTSPQALGLLRTGDASLFDSRLLHAGGANTSPRRRVLFYFSFKVWPRPPPAACRLPLAAPAGGCTPCPFWSRALHRSCAPPGRRMPRPSRRRALSLPRCVGASSRTSCPPRLPPESSCAHAVRAV